MIGDTPDCNPEPGKRNGGGDRRSRLEAISLYLKRELNQINDDFDDLTPLQMVEELVQQSAPTPEEIRTLGLSLSLVQNRIDQFLEGTLDRFDLNHWVCETLKFAITLSLREHSAEGDLVENSLGLMALITDDDFASHDTSRRLCRLVEDRISLRLPVPSRRTISELLRELGVASLIVSERGPCEEDPAWADVALLPRRQDYDTAKSPRTTWFQPLSVCTLKLWQEISPADHWTHVENDRIPALISEEPWLTAELDGLSLYLDPDGITEAVVDTSRIGSRELRKAVAGFRALHQMKHCSIDGIPVHSRKEDL
ncbi:MAG: hypothetical protein VYD70_03195 [Planctomycetota bacterium]|nr:hypothetical protein [Planctomycetota bacterium]